MAVHDRRSLRRAPWLLAAAASLAIAACGDEKKTANGATRTGTPAPPTSPAKAPSEPLGGEWRTEYTCSQSLRAVKRRISEAQVRRQGGWKELFGSWGGSPTSSDPCRGAGAATALRVRFEDGTLVLLDEKTGEVGAEARYQMTGKRSVTVDDDEGNLCSERGCPVRWTFDVSGDKLVFRVSRDAWVVAAWEAAPFHRMS
jgi:hypothetical protein